MKHYSSIKGTKCKYILLVNESQKIIFLIKEANTEKNIIYKSISIKCPEMQFIETDVCVVAWTKGTKNGLSTAVEDSFEDGKSKVPNLDYAAGCMAL